MDRWHRRSIRLPGYDYTQPGAYFVTICVQGHECILGNVTSGESSVSLYGEIVQRCWYALPDHYSHVELDALIVMPNHAHGIIQMRDVVTVGSGSVGSVDSVGAGFKPAPTIARRHGLPEIVRAFKTFSARRINEARGTPGTSVWQRNYYEHIIRNDKELALIRDYIANNALGWERDPENPSVA